VIPVALQPEPANFNAKVRLPGRQFLRRTPHPTRKQWSKNNYWNKSIQDLGAAYGDICAYCAEWIPPITGACSVDHFVPKSSRPPLAYEWSNFRFAASRYNNLKGDFTDVLDPFSLSADWFILDFTSLQEKPNDILGAAEKLSVQKTLDRLQLNDQRAIDSRERWIDAYANGEITFDFLRRTAPFIAYELERQGLRQAIIQIVKSP